jgi:hypothetical protein
VLQLQNCITEIIANALLSTSKNINTETITLSIVIFRHALLERISPLLPQIVRQWLANKKIKKWAHILDFA